MLAAGPKHENRRPVIFDTLRPLSGVDPLRSAPSILGTNCCYCCYCRCCCRCGCCCGPRENIRGDTHYLLLVLSIRLYCIAAVFYICRGGEVSDKHRLPTCRTYCLACCASASAAAAALDLRKTSEKRRLSTAHIVRAPYYCCCWGSAGGVKKSTDQLPIVLSTGTTAGVRVGIKETGPNVPTARIVYRRIPCSRRVLISAEIGVSSTIDCSVAACHSTDQEEGP